MGIKFNTLSHSKWDCKYHLVITPKYRKKILYGEVKKRIGELLRSLSQQKDVEIITGHICPDHIHMEISVPPKYSIAMVVGYLKGKSAILIHNEFAKRYKSYHGKSFWSRGYFVTTIGMNEESIQTYINNQESNNKRADGISQDKSW